MGSFSFIHYSCKKRKISLRGCTILLFHVEYTRDDTIFSLRCRVIENAAAHFLLTYGLFLVEAGTFEKFLSRSKSLLLVWFEIVALQKAAYTEANLGLGPVGLPEALLADLFKVCGTKSENACDQLLILLLAPVVTLLDIEVLEVE